MSVNTSRPPWKGVLRSWSCVFGHSSCVTSRAKQGTRPLYSVLTFRTCPLPGYRPKQASPQSPDCLTQRYAWVRVHHPLLEKVVSYPGAVTFVTPAHMNHAHVPHTRTGGSVTLKSRLMSDQHVFLKLSHWKTVLRSSVRSLLFMLV